MSNYINWGHESPDQISARKRYNDEVFEAMASARAAANAAVGSSQPKNPNDPNQTILWHENNEETGAYTRLLFNCSFAQIIGPYSTGFSDPWYPDSVVPSNVGGYLIQWINDDNGDYQYEFINSRNESIHKSVVLAQGDYVYRDYHTFSKSAQMVSYLTYDTNDTLTWVILYKNEVLSYTFENTFDWSFSNDDVNGVVMIEVQQYVGPSDTPTRNIYMVGNGFSEPKLLNSTYSTVDYFNRSVAWDYSSTEGGVNKDTYADHFSLVEQLSETTEILQMQTFDSTGTLLFNVYEQLTDDYELTLSNYYLYDTYSFGSGRIAHILGTIGTNLYRIVLVSKEEGAYYVSEGDMDLNGSWDNWNVLPGGTSNGETFTYFLYNNGESSPFGLSDGDWEYRIVDVNGNEASASGTGRVYGNNCEFINSEGSLLFPGVISTEGGIFVGVRILKTDGTFSEIAFDNYEFVDAAYFNRAVSNYDHVSGKNEVFMDINTEDGEFVVIHSDELGNMTTSLVVPETSGAFIGFTVNDTYKDSYTPVYCSDLYTSAYWIFNRNSLAFSFLDLSTISDNRYDNYFGSKSEYVTIGYDSNDSAFVVRNDGKTYNFVNRFVDGIGQARITTLTLGEDALYATIYSTSTGEPIGPAVKFSMMGSFGQADWRYSFYDGITGSYRIMTYSGGYAFKYGTFNNPTYNDLYWWD